MNAFFTWLYNTLEDDVEAPKRKPREYFADDTESLNGAAGRALILAREHGAICFVYQGVAVMVQPAWTPAVAASFWQKCRTIANGYEQCEVRKA